VALNGKFPIAPGTRPDSRYETVYDPERGGHYPPKNQPTAQAAKDGKKAA
jgi:hypothetical protein